MPGEARIIESKGGKIPAKRRLKKRASVLLLPKKVLAKWRPRHFASEPLGAGVTPAAHRAGD